MALSEEQCIVSKSGIVTCLQCKVTKGASINGEYYLNERINVDKKELLNVQDDMKELSNLLKIVIRSSVKEVYTFMYRCPRSPCTSGQNSILYSIVKWSTYIRTLCIQWICMCTIVPYTEIYASPCPS
jgi:hypothetical protein